MNKFKYCTKIQSANRVVNVLNFKFNNGAMHSDTRARLTGSAERKFAMMCERVKKNSAPKFSLHNIISIIIYDEIS